MINYASLMDPQQIELCEYFQKKISLLRFAADIPAIEPELSNLLAKLEKIILELPVEPMEVRQEEFRSKAHDVLYDIYSLDPSVASKVPNYITLILTELEHYKTRLNISICTCSEQSTKK